MSEKKSFILYLDRKKEIDMLTNEQCGKLFKAVFEYVDTGSVPEFDELAVSIMFSVIKAQIDSATQKYEDTCRKRSEAGKKGGRPKKANDYEEEAKKANGFSENQLKAKKPDTDTVTVTDTVTDNTANAVLESDLAHCREIMDMYHSICVSYPKLRSLPDRREKAIKARLKTYSIDDFRTVFQNAEASSFMKGSNEHDWSANFDWMMKDANFAKILEGNYNRTPEQSGNAGNGIDYGQFVYNIDK